MTLIRFDRKTLGFLGLLLVFLVSGTAAKLHGSSIGIWNRSFPDRSPNAGVLWGTPKHIRIDEWAFITPAILSQANASPPFPVSNPAWGPERVPLIANLPVGHWSALARPQHWGFFVLDLERAYSFYWNMKAFLLWSGVFLLLMLLTGNNFGVSILGAAWAYFSGFTQWWYSTPAMLPEMVGCVALLLVAAHYLALSPHLWAISAAALVFVLCTLNAALMFYPPFQVPLFYFGIAVLVGSLGPRLAAGHAGRRAGFRIAIAAAALGIITVALALYYLEARSTIDLMRGTLYPASRTSTGGGLSLARVFGGLFGPFMTESSFPRGWFNVCEASNFVLLFPVPMAALLYLAWKRRSVVTLEWCLMAYLLVVLAWLTVGFPAPLALATGFGLSQGSRSLIGMGLASLVLCCVFLARAGATLRTGRGYRLGAAIAPLLALAAFAAHFNAETRGFAGGGPVALVCLIGGAAGYLLLTLRRVAFAIVVLLPSIWSFGLVNPLAAGLGPMTETRLFRQVSQIAREDPDARWAVYGPYVLADLLKAAGANVFNGTKFVPPLDDFRVLDPESSADSTYNRFAHIALVPRKGPGIALELVHGDSYRMHADPAGDDWTRLRIRYVVLLFEATDEEFLRRTTRVNSPPGSDVWIYRYRASDGTADRGPAGD